MYCNNCGKLRPKEGKFCQHCGVKFNNIEEDKEEAKSDTVNKTTKNIKQNPSDVLWEKFAEVYDAQDKERAKFNALSSIHIWELLNRLSISAFENFLQDNKEELNILPYKVIEALKNTYTWSPIGGYRLWLATALLDDKEELNKFKAFTLDDFIDMWKKYNFDSAVKNLPDEVGVCITKFNDWRVNTFMENNEKVKELKTITVDKLKSSLLFSALNGFHAGKIENGFRK